MDYGEGSIYQRHDKDCARPKRGCKCRWAGTLEAGFTEGNKRRRVTVTGRTKESVRRRLRDKRTEINAAVNVATAADAKRKTVHAWADEWMTLRERQVRPNTWTSDRSAIHHYVAPTIGQRRLLDITPADLRAVESKVRATLNRNGKPNGASTVLRVRRTLVKMLRDAVEEGYAVPSGVFAVKAKGQQKGRPKAKRAALELPEAIAVMAAASRLPHGTRYLAAFLAGIRQGEALGLTWDRVDFDAGVIRIDRQLQAVPYADKAARSKGFRLPDDYDVTHLVGRFHLVPIKTASGERVIPMVPTVRDALLSWREAWPANPHGLVWARGNGWPIDKADDTAEFIALQAEAGVKHPSGRPYTTHEMRNTCATLLRQMGADELTITAIMGHSSYVISQGYMTVRSPELLAALAAVEREFTDTTPALG